MRFLTNIKPRTWIIATVVFLLLLSCHQAYGWYINERMAPNTWVGSISIGNLTRDAAIARLQSAIDDLEKNGIRLDVEGDVEIIYPRDIGFDINLGEVIDKAFARGHSGGYLTRQWDRLKALWSEQHIPASVHYDDISLSLLIADIAAPKDMARRDIRLEVEGIRVNLLTDTSPGRVIDRAHTEQLIARSLNELDTKLISVNLIDDQPRADVSLAGTAVTSAVKMLSRPLLLSYEDLQFSISRTRIGSWITSDYERLQLKAGLNEAAIGQYITGIAQALNVSPEPPQITTEDGRVTGFTPPKVGRAVQEGELVRLIITAISDRAAEDKIGDTIAIPMKTSKMSVDGLSIASGISELVGKATTPFTGSPKNRVSNIKNGVKFLSGSIIQPGDEFSTLNTLGVIDNTTGYLPELVIKGDRTIPEFGGGLCQVSTTLFRAVLNAGLPVTARRNHSYRVSYYERDGNGAYIGPGLDATIYEPEPDFKFRNDTAHPILIIGYVVGDKVTFELYGTKDGRKSSIDGPYLLTETAPGEPVYIETTELAPGVIRQVETAHPGGSTIATYVIAYPDGHVASQEFRSYYRRWPAKYLKGVLVLSSPSPSPSPVP